MSRCSSVGIRKHWSSLQSESPIIIGKQLRNLIHFYYIRKANVVVLNCAYDVVHETNLSDEYFGEKQFINVGWGKEETQFQGLAGKKAAVNKGQDLLDPEATGDAEDSSVLITWREDCEYFAVSFLNRDLGRMFKVFNKEGVLQFTSEKCSALQSCIAWRPSGNWIAVPEVYRNKYTISLFEKNGLKHREIVLPFTFDEEFVVHLAWSNDSEILLIHTRQNGQGQDCLYLYTIGNYHWYLKQTLRFDTKVSCVSWSSRSNEKKTLYVCLEHGQVFSYQWNYMINHSLGQTDADQGVVAVIDGRMLLLTGFRGTIVPPPMSNFQLAHGTEINFVRFINESDTNPNQFMIVDTENDVHTYECQFSEGTIRCLTGVEKKGSHTFKTKETVPLKLHKWIYKNDQKIIFQDNKLIFDGIINGNEIDIPTAFELTKPNLGTLILKNGLLYGQYSNGEVTVINNNKEVTVLRIGQFSSQFTMTGEHSVLLQPWQNLYLNEQCLASNVTSFAVVDHFLMYTTLEELRFINLLASQKLVVAERKLERGSKIVLVVPGTSKTVLQLPRGNLETIHPRILSLCMIKSLLDTKSYKKAFEIMRKERINLNLLVDHDPNAFLANIDTFIDDISNIQWLDLFLTELQNIDVIGEMYSYYHLDKLVWEHFPPENKINFVCQRMIETLKKREDSQYCLPLITCYVKKGEVGNALKLIWDLKLKEDNGVSHKGATTSDETFKYLLYLVNVNDLYNIALGLYDFALVLYVAKRSQKDPKEYVPFLEELDKLEENYRRYKIDCYIKRYVAALENISQCGESKLEEAITLIEKHQLYSTALECYKSQKECYETVCCHYGDFLRQKHKLLEASFMYERAGDFQSAISCARNALAWKRCVSLAKRNKSSEEDLNKLFTSLIPALEGAGLYHAAASIAKDYLTRSQAVDILIKGKLYDDAILLCLDKNLIHLVDEKIKPSLIEYLDSLILTVEEEADVFKQQKGRLVTLRVKKANPSVDEDGNYMDDNDDLYSDTSSMNSSRYTTSSG